MLFHCDNILFVYHSVSNVLTVLTILTGTNDYSLYYREWTGDEVILKAWTYQSGRHSRYRKIWTKNIINILTNELKLHTNNYKVNERDMKWYRVGCLAKSGDTLSVNFSNAITKGVKFIWLNTNELWNMRDAIRMKS